MNHKDILLGIGYGEIRFGMSQEQVRKIFGDPDSTERMDYVDDGSQVDDIWDYNDPQLELTFTGDLDFKLTSIKTMDPSILLHEKRLMGSSIAEVESSLEQISINETDRESFDSEIEQICCDDVGLDLWFEAGVLYAVEWSHLWLDDETPKWPEEERSG
jgi:hypothetical protein